MKIAILIPSLHVGGIRRVFINLAEGFSVNDLEVDLVVVNIQEADHLDFVSQLPSNINIVNLNARRALTSILPLMRYLRQERPNVLLAVSEPVNLMAIWARMLTHVPTRIAASIVNTPSASDQEVINRREKVYPLLTKWFYPRADYVIAIAESIREDLHEFIHLPLGKITTINTPVVTESLFERAGEAINHPWFNDDSPPIILGVGRFVPQKDLLTLIQAFAEVRQERPARLVILGDGQERQKLEALVGELGLQDDVWMPGFVGNLPFMKQSDVFVLSSIFEGLPTVLIEALALSPAIVSTDCPGGIGEILNDGECGLIVPMRDPKSLAQAIIQSLDDPIDTALLRKRANDFSMQSIVDKYKIVLGLE